MGASSVFVTAVIVISLLSPTLLSSISDEQREKLDEIDELLKRIEKEINHMKNNDRDPNPFPPMNEKKNFTSQTETQRETTTENGWSRSTSIEQNHFTRDFFIEDNGTDAGNDSWKQTSAPGGGGGGDSFSASYNATDDDQVVATGQPDIPIETQNTQQQNSYFTTVTESRGLNSGKPRDENGVKEEEKEEEKEKEEKNDLNESEKRRRLLDEGEDLEKQLKGVFSQLRSLGSCVKEGEKCGVRESIHGCCKGLKCNSTWSGTCYLDCVPLGQSCDENFFCCPPSTCVGKDDGQGGKAYACQ